MAELLMKTVVVGDSGVGKTNLTTVFASNFFNPESVSTIGVEFLARSIAVSDREVKINIWDTAGQERYRAMPRSMYYKAHAALLVFDLTEIRTFNAIPRWITDIRKVAPDVIFVLVGNKSDLTHIRQIPRETAEKFARENGLCYMETSALNRSNVNEVFEWLAAEYLGVIDGKVVEESRLLADAEKQRASFEGRKVVMLNDGGSDEPRKRPWYRRCF